MLKELKLMEDGRLTRAAVLLLHPKPYQVIPCAYVQIGRFRDDATILYQDILQGSLISLCDMVVDAIHTKYCYNLISYDRTTRHETAPYPERAVREAVYNALMHSDWSSGQPVTIKVYDFKLVINNRSVLPSDWTMEKHDSMHINPLISNTFMYAGFVERFGSGIPKMIKACAEEGNPEPEYTLSDKSISLTLKPSEKYLDLVKELYGSGKVVDNGVNNGQTVVNNRYGVVDNGVNKQPTETFELPGMKAPDRRKKLVELIAANGDVSIEDMALIMSVAKRTIDRDLSWLKDHGYIKKLGKTKDVKWVVLETHGK